MTIKLLVILSSCSIILCQEIQLPEAPETAPKAQEGADLPEVGVRAPSTFVNCECQCDRRTFFHQGRQVGNCLSADQTGANYCFISRRSIQACRDTQAADPRLFGFRRRPLYYSYEACTTPPLEHCSGANFGGPNNFGDGDLSGPVGGFNGRPVGGFNGGFNGGFGGRPVGGFNGGGPVGGFNNGQFGGFNSRPIGSGFSGGGFGGFGIQPTGNGFTFNLANLFGLRSAPQQEPEVSTAELLGTRSLLPAEAAEDVAELTTANSLNFEA